MTAHSVCAELCPGEEGHGAKTRRHQEKGDHFIGGHRDPLRCREVICFFNTSRTSPTMTPSWISTLTRLTESPWRDISIKEPATPLRPGAGAPVLFFFSYLLILFVLYKAFFSPFHVLSFPRRWFSIQKNQLVYQKKFKVCFKCHRQTSKTRKVCFFNVCVFQDQPTVVVEDLRLCTVKNSTENERRFCFEVVSPSK